MWKKGVTFPFPVLNTHLLFLFFTIIIINKIKIKKVFTVEVLKGEDISMPYIKGMSHQNPPPFLK